MCSVGFVQLRRSSIGRRTLQSLPSGKETFPELSNRDQVDHPPAAGCTKQALLLDADSRTEVNHAQSPTPDSGELAPGSRSRRK